MNNSVTSAVRSDEGTIANAECIPAPSLAYSFHRFALQRLTRAACFAACGGAMLTWAGQGASAATRANQSRPNPPSGVLARPAGQFGADSTTSSVSRTIT